MDYAIIAAGEGSRLLQEGIETPKPLVRLNGTTLVDRLIDVFLKNNATSISIIVNEEMRQVQEYLNSLRLPIPFFLLVKSTPSSMHSFYELSRYIDSDRFCLTTVDTIFKEEEFASYIQAFRESEAEGLMAVTDYVDDEKPLYVETDDQYTIRNFHNEATPGCRFVSGGIYCLRRKAIEVLNKAHNEGIHRMRNYQQMLVTEGLRLQAFPFSKIIDVDHADDIVKAESFVTA